MMQLTLNLMEAGAIAPVTTTAQATTSPPVYHLLRFEVGSLAFYIDLRGKMCPCQITALIPTGKGMQFQIRTETGQRLDMPSSALYSGFESEFPPHHLILWGHFTLYELDNWFCSICPDSDGLEYDPGDGWDYEQELIDLYAGDLE